MLAPGLEAVSRHPWVSQGAGRGRPALHRRGSVTRKPKARMPGPRMKSILDL